MAAVAAGVSLSCQDHLGPVGPRLLASVVVVDSSRVAAEDSHVIGSTPNSNQGALTFLRIMAQDHRIVVRFNQSDIAASVGSDSLASAVLQVTLSSAPVNWGPGGRSIDIHRMTRSWTEAGATWNCAMDANPGNGTLDCDEPNNWIMGTPVASRPFVATPTASTLITDGMTGVIQLDVTNDVRAFLAGAANHGWLLKKANESTEGQINIGSKESSAKPRLLLAIVQGDTTTPPIPTTPLQFTFDTTRLVVGFDSSSRYQRDVFVVAFRSGVSGTAIRSFLAQFGATIVGGLQTTRSYIIRVADPASKSAYDSLFSLMNSNANVEYALPMIYVVNVKPGINGRWPRDGAQIQRADWFQNLTDGTRALVHARFPLAWGCQSGHYAGPSVDVAVIDWLFADHSDLSGVVVSRKLPSPIQPIAAEGVIRLQADIVRAHGLLVSGLVGARTDNDSGVAGAAFNTSSPYVRLRQYALVNGNHTLGQQYWGDSIFASPGRDSARVLVIASDFEEAQETHELFANLIRRALRTFLQASPRNVIVYAAGNDNKKRPVAEFASGTVVGNRRLVVQRAIAQMFQLGEDTSRVVIVTAANRAYTGFWSSGSFASNELQGASGIIAAPGEDVRVLWLANGENTVSGTSVAAPLVGGAAAMLLAFDPAIDGAQAKRLLTLDSSVGGAVSVARQRIGQGVVLDAYSPIAMRSRAVAGLPVCDADVYVESTGAALATEWPGTSRTIPRVYLERDTADLVFDDVLRYPRLTLTGPSHPGGLGPLNLFSQFVAGPLNGVGRVIVSPTGEYAIVRYDTQTACTLDEFAMMASIPGPGSTQVTTARLADCAGGQTAYVASAGWANDGRTVAVTRVEDFPNFATGWALGSPPATVLAPTNVSALEGTAVAYTADDSLMVSYERDLLSGTCWRQYRHPATPHVPVGQRVAVLQSRCRSERIILLAPPAYLGADGQRRSGAAHRIPPALPRTTSPR